MHCCVIEVLSHAIIIKEVDSRFRFVVNKYGSRFVKMKRERVGRHVIMVPDKIFGWANPARTEFRFHRNQLDDFLLHADRYGFTNIKVVYREMYEPVAASMSLRADWTAKENQVPIIEKITSDETSIAVTLQTGQGKTSTSLKSAELIGNRLGVIVLGRYYDKWKADIVTQFRLGRGQLMAVKGQVALDNLLQGINTEECSPKAIVFTLGTIEGYIERYYETINPPKWMVPPDRLWEHLGIGFRITDEVHQHPYTNYIIELFTHIPKAVYLSATMDGEDSLTNEMFQIAFPAANRIGGGAYIKISDVICIKYGLQKRGSIPYKGFGGSYNHLVFEDNLMRLEERRDNYYEMIRFLVDHFHTTRKGKDHRLLIFAGRVEMCEQIVEYLRENLSEKYRICKYTAEDDLAIIEEHDIIVTTLGSAGTALDIAGLLTVIMTTAISSRQANEQALGRLRALNNCTTTPLFIYLCCDDIDKHLHYHERKVNDIFRGKTLSYKTISYAHKI